MVHVRYGALPLALGRVPEGIAEPRKAILQKRSHDALECLDRALAVDPHNVADLRNRALTLRKLRRPAEALEGYEALLASRPDDLDALIRRGLLLNEFDRREEALASMDHAVQHAPNDLEVLNARVIVLDNLERYAEALADVDRMLGIERTHIHAINNAGLLLARPGRFGEALRCYDRSLAIQPDQPQARYNRSLVRLALGDWIRGRDRQPGPRYCCGYRRGSPGWRAGQTGLAVEPPCLVLALVADGNRFALVCHPETVSPTGQRRLAVCGQIRLSARQAGAVSRAPQPGSPPERLRLFRRNGQRPLVTGQRAVELTQAGAMNAPVVECIGTG